MPGRLITADVGDTSQCSPCNLTVSTTQARTGTKSFRASTTTTYLGAAVPVPGATQYLRVACFDGTITSSTLTIDFREGTTVHARVTIAWETGVITGLRNSTSLGSVTLTPQNKSQWYVYTMKVVIDDSAGVIQVKRDRPSSDATCDLNLTGQDTRNAGATGLVDNIYMSASANNYQYFDDIKICDDGWPTLHGVYVSVPTGAGSNAGWTASAGSPYVCVNEQPPDYTDYIKETAGSVGAKHDFAIGALPITPDSMGAVEVAVNHKLAAAGTGSVRAYGISNGSESDGSAVTSSTTAAWAECFMATDPSGGGAWTKSRVEAMYAGVERRG